MTEIEAKLREIEAEAAKVTCPEEAYDIIDTKFPKLVQVIRRALEGLRYPKNNPIVTDIARILSAPNDKEGE